MYMREYEYEYEYMMGYLVVFATPSSLPLENVIRLDTHLRMRSVQAQLDLLKHLTDFDLPEPNLLEHGNGRLIRERNLEEQIPRFKR